MIAFGRITLGQYYPSGSAIHRLDPRVKIGLVLLFTVAVFLMGNLWGLLLTAALMFALAKVAHLPIGRMLRSLWPLAYILIFTFLIHAIDVSGEGKEVLASWGAFALTEKGLTAGAFFTLRLALLVVGASFLTLTTSPLELTDGIEDLLRPLKPLRVPAHEIALTITIALRFVPTLLEEAEKIMKAQMSRGADFESGNLFRRAANYLPLMVPLFVGAFRRADELALAMEARGYRGGEGRTRLRELKVGRPDLTAAGVVALSLGITITLGRL